MTISTLLIACYLTGHLTWTSTSILNNIIDICLWITGALGYRIGTSIANGGLRRVIWGTCAYVCVQLASTIGVRNGNSINFLNFSICLEDSRDFSSRGVSFALLVGGSVYILLPVIVQVGSLVHSGLG